MQKKSEQIDLRVLEIANYFIETNSTVRKTANVFGVSKSTVHKDISERLQKISPSLYIKASKLLEINKAQRAVRGGNATKKKYLLLSKIQQDK